jgi:hypothetical protein
MIEQVGPIINSKKITWIGENILGKIHPKAKGINTVKMIRRLITI